MTNHYLKLTKIDITKGTIHFDYVLQTKINASPYFENTINLGEVIYKNNDTSKDYKYQEISRLVKSMNDSRFTQMQDIVKILNNNSRNYIYSYNEEAAEIIPEVANYIKKYDESNLLLDARLFDVIQPNNITFKDILNYYNDNNLQDYFNEYFGFSQDIFI